MKNIMRLTLSQREKFEELYRAIEILFNNDTFGLMYSEIEEAWIVGGVLRDLLLFKNPPIANYDFYLQVINKKDINEWLGRLKDNNIPFLISEEVLACNKSDVFQAIKISLEKFNIHYEINIFIGKISPKQFILNNSPITLSLIGLDISDLFVSLIEKVSPEFAVKKIWMAEEYKKDVKTKTINVLKQKWMKNSKSYMTLESYLEKIHYKFEKLGYK